MHPTTPTTGPSTHADASSAATVAVDPPAATATTFARRLRTILTITLALATLVAGPAAAQIDDLAPGGDGGDPPEEEPPILIPIPVAEPSITIDLVPSCGATPGVTYVIDVHDPYPGQHLYEAHWSVDQQLLLPVTVQDQAGFVATGEGDFVFRGHAQNLGQLAWSGTTDWTPVSVDCSGDGDDGGDGGDGDDGGDGGDGGDDDPDDTEVDDDIVVGDPNFTG